MVTPSEQYTLWHNPRCSKSRAALQILRDKNILPDIRLYLDDPPSETELANVLKLLQLEPDQIIRKKETLYKELGIAAKSRNSAQLVQLLHKHPQLIERPILIAKNSAVIGRPPENVLHLLP